jgi:hypothetical protein
MARATMKIKIAAGMTIGGGEVFHDDHLSKAGASSG